MGQKDLATKKLEDHTDVFADILNTLLFKKNYVDERYLEPGQKDSIYKTDASAAREQHRDTLMNYVDNLRFMLAAIGVENEVKVEKFMPVRTMGYDYGTYKDQMKR